MSYSARAYGTCHGHYRSPSPIGGRDRVIYTGPRVRNNMRQVPGTNQVSVSKNICRICQRTIR